MQLASATPQKDSGFVPWSRFVSANQEVAGREANKVNSQVSGDINAASKTANDASNAFGAAIESNYGHEGDKRAGPRNQTDDQRASGATGGFGSTAGFTTPNAPPSREALTGAASNMTKGFGGSPTAAPTGIAPKSLYAAPQEGNRIGLQPGSIDNPKGSKDLESSMGADAWSKLIGDTAHAQDEAGALGSETGLQGLIQKGASAPLAQGGAFDAALEYGQGQ